MNYLTNAGSSLCTKTVIFLLLKMRRLTKKACQKNFLPCTQCLLYDHQLTPCTLAVNFATISPCISLVHLLPPPLGNLTRSGLSACCCYSLFFSIRTTTSPSMCVFILFCHKSLFVTLFLIPPGNIMPVTLKTVMDELNVKEKFTTMAMCPNCHTFMPAVTDPYDACTATYELCNASIYPKVSSAGIPQSVFNRLSWLVLKKPKKPMPLLSVPFHLLSSLIADFVAHTEIEHECKVWKTSP